MHPAIVAARAHPVLSVIALLLTSTVGVDVANVSPDSPFYVMEQYGEEMRLAVGNIDEADLMREYLAESEQLTVDVEEINSQIPDTPTEVIVTPPSVNVKLKGIENAIERMELMQERARVKFNASNMPTEKDAEFAKKWDDLAQIHQERIENVQIKLQQNIEQMEQRHQQMQERTQQMQEQFKQIQEDSAQRQAEMEEHSKQMRERFAAMEERFKQMQLESQQRMEEIDAQWQERFGQPFYN